MSALGPSAIPPALLAALGHGDGPSGPPSPPLGPAGPLPPGSHPSVPIDAPKSQILGGGPQDDDSAGVDTEDLLQQAADLIHKVIANEPDPEDRAEETKILAAIHKVSADRAKEKDDAMGTSSAMKFVRRQTQRNDAGGGSY